MPRKKKLPIYTLDLETDPFEHGRKPEPFCAGLWNGAEFVYTWGDDCIAEMLEILDSLPPGIIYIHNGGRFDIFYLMDWIVNNPMKIINSRIVKSEVETSLGKHQLRDSYSILPVALGSVAAADGKLDIDYAKMERGEREKHRDEIFTYLKRDVVFLHSLVCDFIEMFGVQLTIGGTAMRQLKTMHNFETLTLAEDSMLRPLYFYGGRVQCFESGIIDGQFKVYDVNSMYPFAMKNFRHPIGKPLTYDAKKISARTHFVTCTGTNYGAFPSREETGLTFTREYGTFTVTRHEFDVAEDLGLFACERVDACVDFDSCDTFGNFVDHFYALRMEAQAAKDEIKKLFYKLILNSAYGKFAQSSDNYCEQRITDSTENLFPLGWNLVSVADISDDAKKSYLIWERPSEDETMYNVATGCSITGAARSILMRAIATARRPIYCDTDSLICEELPGARNTKDLGDWKLEATADRLAIAGKKLYALFENGKCVKQANKGVNITADEILSVCAGIPVTCRRDAPSFKLSGKHNFIEREVRMTV